MDTFEVYKTYLALKSHFNNQYYDYFKYNGRVRANKSTFEKRSDRYFFTKLATKKDISNFLVANFLHNDCWVGDLVNEQVAEKNYLEWKKRIDSLSYVFKNDLDKLEDNFNDNLQVQDGQHPLLLKLYLQKEISPETLLIINDLTNVFRHWNKYITDDIIWPTHCKKLRKYRPFFTIDLEKYRSIVLQKFT